MSVGTRNALAVARRYDIQQLTHEVTSTVVATAATVGSGTPVQLALCEDPVRGISGLRSCVVG